MNVFYLGDDSGTPTPLNASTPGTNLWLVKNTIATPVRLNSPNVTIAPFTVYISPANIDPYTTATVDQPTVTIIATVKSYIDKNDTLTIPLNTTITIPKYDF